MSAHPNERVLLDVIEGGGDAAARQHLHECASCRGLVDEAGAGLSLARVADVPEPSPFFWESFRRQVGRRIREERARPAWRAFLLPALAAAALLVAVGVLRHGTPVPTRSAATLPAWSPLPAADEDESLMVVEALVSDSDDLGTLGACHGMARCLADLSEEESGLLADALRADLADGSSL